MPCFRVQLARLFTCECAYAGATMFGQKRVAVSKVPYLVPQEECHQPVAKLVSFKTPKVALTNLSPMLCSH